ncbi:two-component sensor histidine kinase [Bradyrhizobium sp. GM2.4]
MLVDISERKRAENAQKVLIDELNHRVKNTLATVQSLANQTARHAGDLQEFLPTFTGRLLALARAHDLLTKRNWQDAPFEQLVHDVVAPVSGGRVVTDGPHVDLDARSALSITMVLNELLTNAAKYGPHSRCPMGLCPSLGGLAQTKCRKMRWNASGANAAVRRFCRPSGVASVRD